jgi:hypothetical protein
VSLSFNSQNREVEVLPGVQPDNCSNLNLVTNLSSTRLAPEEAGLLSKGPKFSVLSIPRDRTVLIDEYRVGFQRLLHNVRWQCLNNERNGYEPVQLYPPHKEIHLPNLIPEVEVIIQQATHKYVEVLKNLETMKMRSNLSHVDWRAVRSLRSRNLVIDTSDKGGEFCITDKSVYHDLMVKELTVTGKFRRIAKIKIDKVEDRLNNVWRGLCLKYKISKHIEKHYVSLNSNYGSVKGLVKTHKISAEGDTKIRLVMNTIGTPGYRLSWLLCKNITPSITKCTSSRSSIEIIELIKNVKQDVLAEVNYPFSLDVVDMYHKVPRKDAISCLVNSLTEAKFSLLNIQPHEIGEVIDVILRSNQFWYEDSLYIQATGLPIGNRLSGILADAFISDLEKKVISQIPNTLYYRYVDDYLFLTRDEQSARHIHQLFDSCDDRLRFELELPSQNGSLSLLDFTIKIDNGNPIFSFYQKPCRKPVFVHATSGIPKHHMQNIVNNELSRIGSRCSGENDKKECLDRFQQVLRDRGHKLKPKDKHKTNVSKNDKKFFLNVPFVSDKINGMVRKALKPLGLNVSLSHKSKRLRDILQKKSTSDHDSCDYKNCFLKNKDCTRTHVVYQMKCSKCGATYIGSTKRKLHQRIKEHMTHKSSLVYQHHIKCGSGKWSTSVLYCCHHIQQLRFMESMLIKRHSPNINVKENVFNEHIVF